jgi:hypothetical protein
MLEMTFIRLIFSENIPAAPAFPPILFQKAKMELPGFPLCSTVAADDSCD